MSRQELRGNFEENPPLPPEPTTPWNSSAVTCKTFRGTCVWRFEIRLKLLCAEFYEDVKTILEFPSPFFFLYSCSPAPLLDWYYMRSWEKIFQTYVGILPPTFSLFCFFWEDFFFIRRRHSKLTVTRWNSSWVCSSRHSMRLRSSFPSFNFFFRRYVAIWRLFGTFVRKKNDNDTWSRELGKKLFLKI